MICKYCNKVLRIEREPTGTCSESCRAKLWRDNRHIKEIHKGNVGHMKVNTIEKLGFKVFIIEAK